MENQQEIGSDVEHGHDSSKSLSIETKSKAFTSISENGRENKLSIQNVGDLSFDDPDEEKTLFGSWLFWNIFIFLYHQTLEICLYQSIYIYMN